MSPAGWACTWRTEAGREYVAEQHWRCQECDAHLEDEHAVVVHDAWHALRKVTEVNA